MILPTRPISPWFEQKPAKDAKDYTTRKQLFLRELRVFLLKILISGGPRIATIQPVHGLLQPLQKNQAVIVGFKHHLAAIATGHDMIHRSRILESQRPRHAIFSTIAAPASILICRDARPPFSAHGLS